MHRVINTQKLLLVLVFYLILQHIYGVGQLSRPVQFDLLLDENITINDPRIKSMIYASLPKRQILITYTNPNAKKLAFKIADIFAQEHLAVIKPIQTANDNPRYVLVYVRY